MAKRLTLDQDDVGSNPTPSATEDSSNGRTTDSDSVNGSSNLSSSSNVEDYEELIKQFVSILPDTASKNLAEYTLVGSPIVGYDFKYIRKGAEHKYISATIQHMNGSSYGVLYYLRKDGVWAPCWAEGPEGLWLGPTIDIVDDVR